MTDPLEPAIQPPPSSWRESAVEFVSARMDLFALEAKDASQSAARRVALIILICGCAVIAWMAVVAGLIGWIAASQGEVPWHFVAIGMAVFHLLLAGIAAAVLRRPAPPAFPLLKAELSKDREWLTQIKEAPKH